MRARERESERVRERRRECCSRIVFCFVNMDEMERDCRRSFRRGKETEGIASDEQEREC